MGEYQLLSVKTEYYCDCFRCGVPIYGPSVRHKMARERGEEFFCVNGHGQVYTKSENAKLKEQLEKAEQARDRAVKEKEWAEQNTRTARRAESIAKGKLKAQSERIKAGVCPCCNRTVSQLARHMKSKHPDWKGPSED